MKILENKKIKNNDQYKRGFELGMRLAEKLEKADPEKYAKIKEEFEKIMKGEKNVNL